MPIFVQIKIVSNAAYLHWANVLKVIIFKYFMKDDKNKVKML